MYNGRQWHFISDCIKQRLHDGMHGLVIENSRDADSIFFVMRETGSERKRAKDDKIVYRSLLINLRQSQKYNIY